MRRASGAMFGLAYGDSLGAPTEFLTTKQIHRRFGDHGPTQLNGDPALVTGAGWIAEEALATGLLCFLLFPDEPVEAIWRGAASSGDSDSIACLAGAFAGAHLGLDAWPDEWRNRIEYASDLAKIGRAWD